MKNSRRYTLFALIFLLIGALTLFPDRYIGSVKYGLNLYAVAVLPALFPFFFLSKLLTSLDFGFFVGKIFRNPLKNIYHAPPVGGYIFVLSVLSGYPIGARLIADCHECGLLSKEEAKNIFPLCSTSGPLFVIGTVGYAMLGSTKAGLVIFAAHILATMVNALLFVDRRIALSPSLPKVARAATLSECMTDSIVSVAIVGGYIAVFSFVIDLLGDLKLFSTASALFPFLPREITEGFLSGLIEVTRGCKTLGEASVRAAVPIAAALISFGGVSVSMQNMTFLQRVDISANYYFLVKFGQVVLTFFFAFAMSFLL